MQIVSLHTRIGLSWVAKQRSLLWTLDLCSGVCVLSHVEQPTYSTTQSHPDIPWLATAARGLSATCASLKTRREYWQRRAAMLRRSGCSWQCRPWPRPLYPWPQALRAGRLSCGRPGRPSGGPCVACRPGGRAVCCVHGYLSLLPCRPTLSLGGCEIRWGRSSIDLP